MSAKLRQLQSVVVRQSANGYRFTGIASTASVDVTDGLVIDANAWDTTRFMRLSGPIFWNHDYREAPIGRAVKVWSDHRGLMSEIELDGDDPKAAGIARKIQAGLVNSLSVGFRVLEQTGNRVTRAILDEISVVSLPADDQALIVARSAFARPTRSTPAKPFDEAAWNRRMERHVRELQKTAEGRQFLRDFHASFCPPGWREKEAKARAERRVRRAVYDVMDELTGRSTR